MRITEKKRNEENRKDTREIFEKMKGSHGAEENKN